MHKVSDVNIQYSPTTDVCQNCRIKTAHGLEYTKKQSID